MASKMFATLAGLLAVAQAVSIPVSAGYPGASQGIMIPSDLPDGYYAAIVEEGGQQRFEPINIAISGSVINAPHIELPTGTRASCSERTIADQGLFDDHSGVLQQFYNGCAGLESTQLIDNRAFFVRKGQSVACTHFSPSPPPPFPGCDAAADETDPMLDMCNYAGTGKPRLDEWVVSLELIRNQCGQKQAQVGKSSQPRCSTLDRG